MNCMSRLPNAADSVGIPPMPSDRKVLVGLLILLGIGGALFPLTGATLLVMILLDLAVQRFSRRSDPAST